ncbi:MAG: choice-of-anchor D domain-containing protein, partial [Deltaproteobacteria bacterium]|nr:choice-of-anchor D domain-containing protein [Deltaproteobacteria bacterium]
MLARFKVFVGAVIGLGLILSGSPALAQDITLDPPGSYNFGTVKVGETATLTVDINHDLVSGNVNVQTITIDDDRSGQYVLSNLPTLPIQLDETNVTSTSFDVSCTPTAVGAVGTSTITVNSNASDPTLDIDCAGGEPGITDPADRDFGTIAYDGQETASETITFTNDGTYDLTVAGIAVTGDYTVTSPTSFPITVAPGDDLDVVVEFQATAVGTRTGVLTVTSDATGSPTTTVNLSGTAIAHLRVDPLSHTFNSIPEGTTDGPVSISICNDGTREIAINSITLNGGGNFTGGTVPAGPIAASSCVTYDVTFTPQDDGSFTGTVDIDTDATGVFAVTVDLDGVGLQVAASYTATPSNDFGDVNINTGTGQIDVDWNNDGSATLNVLEVLICEDQVTTLSCATSGIYTPTVTQALPRNVNGGGKIDIAVEVDPVTIGSATDYLRVAYR